MRIERHRNQSAYFNGENRVGGTESRLSIGRFCWSRRTYSKPPECGKDESVTSVIVMVGEDGTISAAVAKFVRTSKIEGL